MKKLFLIALLACIKINAAVITVDNNPGSSAQYSSLPAAVNGATSGDTIIVMPSNITYDNTSIGRKLYIYSRGHSNERFLVDKDRLPIVNGFNLNSGSSGTVIEGILVSNSSSVSENNITFKNCRFSCYYINFYNTDNNLIEGCIFQGNCGDANILKFNSNCDNNIVRNCWVFLPFYGGTFSGVSHSLVRDANSSNLFTNNLFVVYLNNTATATVPVTLFSGCAAKFTNNIIWTNEVSRTRLDTFSTGATFKNNITYSVNTTLPDLPGTNNINDKDPELEMGATNNNPPVGYPGTFNLRLKSTSPAKNKGLDSTDMGLYGNEFNFTNDGLTTGIPIFEDFTILNPVIKQGGTLKVRIRARKPE